MNNASHNPQRYFVGLLLLLTLITGLILPSARAQDTTPGATPTVTDTTEPKPTAVPDVIPPTATAVPESTVGPSVTEADSTVLPQLVTTAELSPTTVVDQTPTPIPGEAEPLNPTPNEATPAEAVPAEDLPPEAVSGDEVLPEASPGEEVSPESSPSLSIVSPQVQGEVTIDVIVAPERLMSGADIQYTYKLKNTGSQIRNNIIIEAIWANFINPVWQKCATVAPNTNCDPFAITAGLTVTRLTTCPANIISDVQNNSRWCYQVSSLAAGASGEFSVRLQTVSNLYPTTGKSPTRPSGSARLYLEGAANRLSDDTVSTLIVGPVFVLSKVAVSTAPIYPLESTEFVITVGNATGSGDFIGGVRREDAIDATDPKIVDSWPIGSEPVPGSVTAGGVIDSTNKTITWQPGRIKPGETKELRARFKKLDVKQECGTLNNSRYNVTSSEMPIQSGTARYVIIGNGASVRVVTPVAIKSITANPGRVKYGEEAALTIIAQNFYNKPVNGAQFKYYVQSNAAYIAGSASNIAPNTLISAPNGAEFGSTVVWNLNIPAGTMTAPSEVTFTLRVRGGYTSAVAGGTGQGQIVIPADIPSACTDLKGGSVPLDGRLNVKKLSATGTNFEYVEQGDHFTYVITIQNTAATDAVGVTITDLLPRDAQFPPNFSYIPNSATLNGTVRNPDSHLDGNGGNMVWNGIDIPAGQTITLSYQLLVQGYEYVKYLNNVSVTLGAENIIYSNRQVTVKINPPIKLSKTVDTPTTTIAGDTVRFSLSLENQSSSSYQLALYDILGPFTYVRQISGYDTPTLDTKRNALDWPVVNVAPGGKLEAVIEAKIPNVCATNTFVNELAFLFNSRGDVYIVHQIPAMTASVKLTCGTNKIEYSKSVNREIVSLKDQIIYTLSVRNVNTTAAINTATVVDVLPQGFKYMGIATGGDITSAPQQKKRADERIELTWQIASIAAGKTVKIAFAATAGEIAGPFDNWMRATAPDLLEAKCVGRCLLVNDNGEAFNYAYAQVKVQPLITIEPTINDTSCAQPGDKRSYRLSIVNTNIHGYQSTVVTVTLPLGLKYLRPLNGSLSPTTVRTKDGTILVVWKNLNIPKKPDDKTSALLILEIELEAGQTWRSLPTKLEVTSPDGAVPLKDGVLNPIVRMCPSSPAISKLADRDSVLVGDEYFYEISIVNTTNANLTATISDELPANVTFVEQVLGPKATTVNGQRRTWANLTVPPAANAENPGELIIRFKVKVSAGSKGDTIVNKVLVDSSDPSLNTERNTAIVSVTEKKFVYFTVVSR